MNLHLLKYNNYYNRIIKRENSLTDYLTYQVGSTYERVNFIPNDGVSTVQDLNVSFENLGDYLICEEDNQIKSRWFVMECNRLRNGQYRLRLRRDLIVDNIDAVLDAPCFIEKATLSGDNPLIFNNENMTFNQIKKSETLLKDSVGCAWIVGYIDNKAKMETSAEIEYNKPSTYDTKDNFENLWNSANSGTGKVYSNDSSYFYYKYDYRYSSGYQNYYYYITSSPDKFTGKYFDNKTTYEEFKKHLTELDQSARQYLNTTNQINKILGYNGKFLLGSDNQIYQCIITSKEIDSEITPTGNLLQTMTDVLNEVVPNAYNPKIKFRYKAVEYSVEYVLIKFNPCKFQIQTHTTLKDEPYSMFAIPYGAIKANILGTTLNLSEEFSKLLATLTSSEIIRQFGGTSASLFDIQILPYCPFQNKILADGSIAFDSASDITKITDSNDSLIGFIAWAQNSRFNLSIPYNIKITDTKVQNECEFYRLCSPNFNGQFEFSASKNNGVEYFNIDCYYKPYQPYIHVAPNFKGLYGSNFGDARGLICAGDFSLTQISDSWETFKRQNANYENVFNRQIENMQFNNRIQDISAIVGGISSALGVGVSAGQTMGAGAGIAGGTVSLLGGIADYAIQKSQQAEALDYKRDMFGYSLGNIKALPNSLTKVSSLNPNNKVFPVLEFYSCTDEEKEALISKLKYNGMSVGKIGKMRDYLRDEISYIKGQLIRIDLNEDFNYLNEIANEIIKGVYI